MRAKAFVGTSLAILVAVVCVATLTAPRATAQAKRTTLDMYVIDVEGGNAMLFVPPSGDTVLIDTGNTPPGSVRDAERIMAAAHDAGITQINHLIITHWHGDHWGGLAELAKRIPIKQFNDHGPSVEHNAPVDEFLNKTYPAIYAKGEHRVVKPGDTIPVQGLEWHIVSAAGNVLTKPLPGAGKPNPYCAETKPMDPDPTENAQSVGSVVNFGKFRVVHLGDLTWNKEINLMCPVNRIGTTDLLMVSHHGQPISNSPALIYALHPRVAIINNGTRKGGQPDAMKIIFASPGLQDVWQMHFSLLSGQEYTVPGMFIANTVDEQPAAMPIQPLPAPVPGTSPVPGGPPAPTGPAPAHNGQAYWIKISAQSNGTFTVTNMRNHFSKTYVK